MKTDKEDKEKGNKVSITQRVFGLIFAVLHLTAAFIGGVTLIQFFQQILTPYSVVTNQIGTVTFGVLLITCGIFGSWLSLHFLFEGTKLERLFPGLFSNWN